MRRFAPARPILAHGCFAHGFLAALGLAVAAAPAFAQCPESAFKFPVLVAPMNTSALAFDTTSTDGSWVRGDHRTGEYTLHHSGYLSATSIIARDRFEVTGVPPGTLVSVTMRLRVEGWTYTGGCGGTGCCGLLDAWVRTGADSASSLFSGQTFGGRADFSGVVEVPVTFIAGTPRDLGIEMSARRCAGGAHTVDATGRVVFEGTIAAASIVSCKGFGPRSVPVLRRSWGQVKTIYR